MKLRIKICAYRNCPDEEIMRAKKRLAGKVKSDRIEWVDKDPDILFFITGGSEYAVHGVIGENRSRTIILLAGSQANAYAAATEVHAYLMDKGIRSQLFHLDESGSMLQALQQAWIGIHTLKGQTLGLIGKVSEWLLTATITPKILGEKMGIQLKEIPWSQLESFQTKETSREFIDFFSQYTANIESLAQPSRVYKLLNETRDKYRLDALAVECFSLVQKTRVTGCLALAKLMEEGVVAACEGDIASAVAMMVAKEVTGTIPWMVNTVEISKTDVLFAHCTAPPGLMKEHAITSHYETGIGTALEGKFSHDQVTIFRLNHRLDHCFLSSGTVLARPGRREACRSQLLIKLPQPAAIALKEKPLGNHHLILPADRVQPLRLAFDLLNIE